MKLLAAQVQTAIRLAQLGFPIRNKGPIPQAYTFV